METGSRLPTRLGDSLIRIGVGVHFLGSLGFWLLQPRGFAWGSRSFVEHQVLTPAIFAVSAAALAAGLLKRPTVASLAVAVLSGFWVASGGVIAGVGTTAPSRLFWIVPPAAMAMLLMVRRLSSTTVITGGTVVGTGLAAAFWACTWAPPATTRPRGGEVRPDTIIEEASSTAADGIHVSVSGNMVLVKSEGKTAAIWPGFDYDAVSDSGIWSLFQFRSTSTPSWTCSRSKAGGLALTAENEDFHSAARIRIENHAVHLQYETRVKRELASHLSSVLQFGLWGKASLHGIPWNLGNSDPRCEFIAVRQGRTEFLRASSGEKGPFETLGAWPLENPTLMIDGWSIQLLGWAEQGSHEPSPTAGWGVSQAAIERAGTTYFWSLASTSIGRGWHTVRTAPGVYVLEAVITPP